MSPFKRSNSIFIEEKKLKLEVEAVSSVLGAIISYIGESVDALRNDFNARLRVQKTVYLLQLHPEFRKWLKYNFNLYLKGPYSPNLAQAYYSLENKHYPLPALSEEALTYLKLIREMNAADLEFIASAIEALRINPEAEKDEIRSKVASLKPHFKPEDVADAIDRALELKKRFNLQF